MIISVKRLLFVIIQILIMKRNIILMLMDVKLSNVFGIIDQHGIMYLMIPLVLIIIQLIVASLLEIKIDN